MSLLFTVILQVLIVKKKKKKKKKCLRFHAVRAEIQVFMFRNKKKIIKLDRNG